MKSWNRFHWKILVSCSFQYITYWEAVVEEIFTFYLQEKDLQQMIVFNTNYLMLMFGSFICSVVTILEQSQVHKPKYQTH